MANTTVKAGITNKRDLITKAKSSQFLVVIVASVIVSASLIGIKILWGQRTFQQRIISAKTDARDQLEDNLKAIEELKKEFNKLESSKINSNIVLDALPSKYDFPALATSIEKVAQSSGVTLDSFVGDDRTASAVDSASEPTPEEIVFGISVSGSYSDVAKFVQSLHKSIRPFKIEEMSLESAAGKIQLNVKVVTYYAPTKNMEITKEKIKSSSGAAAKDDKKSDSGASSDQKPSSGEVPADVDTSGVPQ